jgi:hypothetical protein
VQGISSLLGITGTTSDCSRYADTEAHSIRCLAEYAKMDEVRVCHAGCTMPSVLSMRGWMR